MANESSTTYQGQPVTLVRVATMADAGYTAPASGAPAESQLLVRFADGHEEVVLKAEIEGTFTASNEPAEPSETAPPTNVDVPLAVQIGSMLNCTMGNWENMQAEPHSYGYQWQREGADVAGATAADYTVTAEDQDRIMACVVTATNALGSASATSNEVVVTTP